MFSLGGNAMNPFETMFGREPKEYIHREEETEKIIKTFDDESSLVYLITGVRGSGKTVLLSHVSKIINERNDWIVIDLNPEQDLLSSLVSKLYVKAGVSKLFIKKNLSLSFGQISLTLTSGELLTDSESILEVMLKDLKKRNKKLLITIDEVSNNSQMKVFVHSYQSLVRQDFPVYLLMTGLYENIQSLQNEKTLTFLYRAPRIALSKLNNLSIYYSYLHVFLNAKLAEDMTKCVSGYAFAYQLLGKIVYESQLDTLCDEILNFFDKEISEYCYSKIWSECNETDKKIIKAICSTDGSNAQIMNVLQFDKSKLSVYRDRLIKKGLVESSSRGYLSLTLPRFDQYIKICDMFD